MFDADVAQLWKAGDGRLKVIWRDPPDDRAPPGHVVEPRDYPGMQRSLERLDTTFFRDARTTVTGEALERVLEEGVRSVLRVPIVVAGRAELLLALRWARVVPDPTPELLALVRRFADHAGLVIEQGERRRAEATEQIARARAERLAGDLAQLHAVATSLGAASTASEVAALVAERVQAISGAETTVVFYVTPEGDLAPLASFASDAARARERGRRGAGAAYDGGVPAAPAWREEEDGVVAAVPLLVEGDPIGLLVARYCARADSRRGNAASRRDHRRARGAAARARAPARARARGAGAGRALRPPDPPPSGADGRLRRRADARGGGRDAPRRDVRGRRRRRRGACRDRRRGARAERRALARLPRGAARAGRRRPTHGRRARRDGGPAPGGVLLREHRRAPRRAPRAARLARGGRFALVRVPPRERRRSTARRRRVRVVAARPAGRRRARVPRGGRLAVRPRARPGTPLRERARRRRDAPAERPPGDRSLDGGRARRRALPARVERGRRRWRLVRHADALGRAARVRRRRRRRKGRAGGRDDGAAPERDAGDHPRPADARGDRDEAQPPPRALHRRAVRHARVPRLRPRHACRDARLGGASAAARPRPRRDDARTSRAREGFPSGSMPALPTRSTRSSSRRARSSSSTRTASSSAEAGRSTRGSPPSRARRSRRRATRTRSSTRSSARCSAPRRDRTTSRCSPSCSTPRSPSHSSSRSPPPPSRSPSSAGSSRTGCARPPCSDLDARDILLATWEAGANAIEHSGATDGAVVEVSAMLSGDRIRIGVADHGRWKEPEIRDDRGLGLRLIEALMTTVDVERGPDGTRVVMERPLTRERPRTRGTSTADN